MGQILHGSATTTHAIRAAIQRSKAPLKELAAQHGLNHKTVAKWRKRTFVHDAPMGPKDPRSTVLSAEDEAIAVAFRKHTLLPLDDCLYALQATIPHLTRSSLHRCLKRHGISRLPEVAGDKTFKKPFKRRPIGYFHIDIAEVRTGEGKLYLFVAIDRTSKFAFAQHPQTAGFLETSLRLQNWANAWWWAQSDSNESPSQNSRKTGKKTGNLRKRAWLALWPSENSEQRRQLAGKFPLDSNREFAPINRENERRQPGIPDSQRMHLCGGVLCGRRSPQPMSAGLISLQR
jgi:transposase-like protein